MYPTKSFIHDNHKFNARTFQNQKFMNIDFIVISAHKQKQKRVCVICIKWALCISDVYMHAFTIICYNVLEKHPCYNCGDPIIFSSNWYAHKYAIQLKHKYTFCICVVYFSERARNQIYSYKKFIFLLLKTCKCIPDALYFIYIFQKNGNNMKHTVNQTIYLAAWHAISNSIYYYYRLYIHTCIIQIEVDVFLYFKPFSPFSTFYFLGEYKHASLLIFLVFQIYANTSPP